MTIRSTIVIEIQPEWVVKNLFCMANIYPYNFSLLNRYFNVRDVMILNFINKILMIETTKY